MFAKNNLSDRIFLVTLVFTGCIAWITGHWPLLTGEYIFSHDSYYWYGIFHYFADSIYNGVFPLWNPYIHSGETFFTYIGSMMLVDPVNIFGIMVGKLFHVNDLIYLYEIIIFARLIIIAAGIQLLINTIIPEIKKYWYFSFFIILLSSFTINSYHQNGAFLFFGYTPFVLLFIVRLLRNPNWINAVMLGYFSGISFQSYQFAAIGTFVLLFTILYLVFNRESFRTIWKNRLKVAISILLFIIFSSPAWSLIFYRSYIFPYSRYIFNQGLEDTGIFISDINILRNSFTAYGQWGDFYSLGFLPLASEPYTGKIFGLFNLTILSLDGIGISEMNMYIAFIPFTLGLIGIFKGKSSFKMVFLILMFLSGCLFLGPIPYNYIYTILFYALPSIRVIENTHIFASFFMFFYLFFMCLGLIFLISKIRKEIWKKVIIIIVFVITLFELNLYVYKIYGDQSGGISLLKKDRIVEDNIDNIDSYDVEEIMLPNLSDTEKTIFLNNYEEYGDSYRLKEDISIDKVTELKDILERFFILGIDVGSSGFTFVNKRVKTLMPYSFSIIREKPAYSSTDIKERLNFQGQIKKVPTATDHFLENNYNLNSNTPPRALTMPVLYKDILKSEASQELKGKLLGVGLPILEFYTGYVFLDPEEIIDPEKSDMILGYLNDMVILYEEGCTSGETVINGNGSNYQINLIYYDPNRITLEVDTDKDGVLLFRDGYNTDWKAVIDGNKQKVMQANYNQKAVFVEKGIHEVEFVFEPLAYLISLYLYFTGTAILIIFLIFYFSYHTFYKKRKTYRS